MPKLTTEKIAEIREALRIISIAAETVDYHYPVKAGDNLTIIREEVASIDKLLPDEGVK